MFTKDDYKSYFDELEGELRETLIIYTDLLNELSDQSIRNKLYAILVDKKDAYKFIKSQKEKFV